jgi:hypothetical protein
MGLKWLIFLIGHLYVIGMLFGEDQRVNDTCLKEIRLPNINDYYTLNSEYNWEDLYINLRNQQTCTSDNLN